LVVTIFFNVHIYLFIYLFILFFIFFIYLFIYEINKQWNQWESKTLTQNKHTFVDPSSLSIFSGVRIGRSLVFCVMFCRWLFVLCPFSFSHCIVCPIRLTTSNYAFGIFKLFRYVSFLMLSYNVSAFITKCIRTIYCDTAHAVY
jgi:hypothetical protein